MKNLFFGFPPFLRSLRYLLFKSKAGDWAIVKEDEAGQNKVYLVRETKGTTVWLKVPETQRKKIQCGKAHFKAVGLKDGEYDWVESAKDV